MSFNQLPTATRHPDSFGGLLSAMASVFSNSMWRTGRW
ncbi:hypothetical protein SAMCFNEI73_pA0042 (plasmid) [Sinorhizobium americanum]|uniref:Uncharacterized protein n=1 Tax=Sinorhizobium americanum TaxID=194963 RepID=A0A1L3LSG1_9HYPH|nr:hypothetical protein SAMCFNEI73_pA0042 [Sinorhizobium americanum]